MDNFGFGDELYERNRQAQALISARAAEHVARDVKIGIAGLIGGFFVPGLGLAATVAAVVSQFPFYRRLSSDLGMIYESSEDKYTSMMRKSVEAEDAAYTAGAYAGRVVGQAAAADLLSEGFVGEIAREMFGEAALAAAGALIPLVGGAVALALDAKIAATMTWRIGVLVSAYYQNGEKWVGGSRKATYRVVKPIVGRLSAETANRTDINNLPAKVDEIRETLVAKTVAFIKVLQAVDPNLSARTAAEMIAKSNPGLAPDIAADAIRRAGLR